MSELRAEFEMTNGVPNFTQGEKYRHYAIRLSVLDAPEDVLTIIYQLDDTYENPIRMVTRGVPNYQEYITSYGDYPVRISYRPIGDPNKLRTLLSRKLSDALSASYQPSIPEPVQTAIRDIADH
jgi:hypothetical protein